MTPDEDILLLQDLLRLKQAGKPFMDEAETRNPVSHYRDPVRFEQEQQAIFERLPTMLAHVSELPEPHSFLRRTANGRPLLLTRGETGEIRVFLNVCPPGHRRGGLQAAPQLPLPCLDLGQRWPLRKRTSFRDRLSGYHAR